MLRVITASWDLGSLFTVFQDELFFLLCDFLNFLFNDFNGSNITFLGSHKYRAARIIGASPLRLRQRLRGPFQKPVPRNLNSAIPLASVGRKRGGFWKIGFTIFSDFYIMISTFRWEPHFPNLSPFRPTERIGRGGMPRRPRNLDSVESSPPLTAKFSSSSGLKEPRWKLS